MNENWLRPILGSVILAGGWAVIVLTTGGPDSMPVAAFMAIDTALLVIMVWASHGWRVRAIGSRSRASQFGRAVLEGAVAGAVIGAVAWATAGQAASPDYLGPLLVPVYAIGVAAAFVLLCGVVLIGRLPSSHVE